MAFAAQPAGIYAYTGTAQVAAACRITGVAVDAVDGDTCIELAAFKVLHFVDAALEGCIILAELTVISAVGAQLAPVVTSPNAALSRFFITAQLAMRFISCCLRLRHILPLAILRVSAVTLFI